MVSILKTDKIQASHGSTIEIPSGHKITGAAGSIVAPGHVIQVKQGILPHASGMSTTSTSYVTTGHTITITPSSASSKISLFNSSTLYNGNGHNIKVTITKNHSGISETDLATSANGFTQLHTPSAAIGSGSAIVFLDSPSTTNEITYTIKIKVSGGTGYYPIGGDALVQVMEIAG